MARKRARWKTYQSRIAPLKAYAPYGHWKTLAFIAALRHDRIDAPWVIDGPINGELFLLYVETILPPPRHQPAALIRRYGLFFV